MATSLTFESAASAWVAAPVPRSPQPIRPTRSTSLPAACTFGSAAIVAGGGRCREEVTTRGDRVRHGGVLSHFFKRVQLELPDEQLEPLGLQQDLAGRGEDVVTLVDGGAVDAHRDPAPVAEALDPRPLARRALDVVLAAGVEQLLEIGIVPRPPELPVGEDPRLAPLLPARPLVGPEHGLAREPHGDRLAVRVLAADDDQVADAPLGELALDRRHPRAAGAAIRARSRAGGCRSFARTCRRRSSCPTCTPRSGDSRGTPCRWRGSRSRRR